MYTRKVYQQLASAIDARLNCEKANNDVWFANHTATIKWIEDNCLPSGSGFDSGSSVDLDKSTGEKIVIYAPYHRMDGESGMYDGWVDFTITVKASLIFSFAMRITGGTSDDKEYVSQTFEEALSADVELPPLEVVTEETV